MRGYICLKFWKLQLILLKLYSKLNIYIWCLYTVQLIMSSGQWLYWHFNTSVYISDIGKFKWCYCRGFLSGVQAEINLGACVKVLMRRQCFPGKFCKMDWILETTYRMCCLTHSRIRGSLCIWRRELQDTTEPTLH